MKRFIAQISLLVNDYDEAIAFYRDKLQFVLVEDTRISETKRWVVMRPAGNSGCRLLLAKAVNATQQSRVGDQTGGRVFLFLHTDDCRRDYQLLSGSGVEFARQPTVEVYGTVAVFKDLYGNLWDMIGPVE